MILVIGGRSNIGSALIESLLGRDQRVRALVREGGTVARLTGQPARSLDDLLGELGPD